MTATSVNGQAVMNDEAIRSSLGSHPVTGQPIFFSRMRLLTLADGSKVHGCSECDFTAEKLGSVRGHLKVHSTKGPSKSGSALDLLAAEMDLLAAEMDHLAADRDQWKARAQTAERSIRQLRRALGVTTTPGDQAT